MNEIATNENKDFNKKEYMKIYNKQIIQCSECGVSFARCNKDHHNKSQKHLTKIMINNYNKKINDLENKVQIIKKML